jgi:peptide/nickel transport system substrate-binding protein
MKLSRHLIAQACVLVVFATAACGGSSTPSTSKTYLPGGTMTIRVTSAWTGFDPQKDITGSNSIMPNFYATLVSVNPAGEIIPYVAKSWTQTPTSITFALKSGVTCGDGSPLTPTAVKNSLQRMIDIKAAYNLVRFGPGPYSVTADDAAGTVTFNVGTPYGALLYGFVDVKQSHMTGIICPTGLANPSLMANQTLGVGPYNVVENVHGDHLTTKLRPDFTWGPAGTTAKTLGLPDTVIFKQVDNDTTAANLLLSGGLDVATVNGPDIVRLLADKSLNHYDGATYTTLNMAFGETAGRPGADMTVRKALITAIDPKAFMQVAFNGLGKTSSTVITSDGQCYDPQAAKLAPKPSIDAARNVLLSAGWTMSNGKLTKDGKVLKVHFTQPGSGSGGLGAEYVVSQWNQMGVDAVLDAGGSQQWATAVVASNFDATVVATGYYFPLMNGVAGNYNGPPYPQGNNFPRINDPIINTEVPAALAASGAAACQHWASVQQELWNQWHLLPLGVPQTVFFSPTFDFSLEMPAGMVGGQVVMLRRIKK